MTFLILRVELCYITYIYETQKVHRCRSTHRQKPRDHMLMIIPRRFCLNCSSLKLAKKVHLMILQNCTKTGVQWCTSCMYPNRRDAS